MKIIVEETIYGKNEALVLGVTRIPGSVATKKNRPAFTATGRPLAVSR